MIPFRPLSIDHNPNNALAHGCKAQSGRNFSEPPFYMFLIKLQSKDVSNDLPAILTIIDL